MIRRGFKKLLPALLAAALCLTLRPVPAEAADRKPDKVIFLDESASFNCTEGNGKSYTWWMDEGGYDIFKISYSGSRCTLTAKKPGRTQLWVQYTVTIPGYSYIDAYTGTLVQMPPMDDYETRGWLVEAAGEPCTVTFNRLDGLPPESRTAYKGGTVSAPTEVSRPGFLLDGWFMDLALTQRFDFSTPLAGDLTLYARWNIARTVTFMSRGEAAEVKPVADGKTVSPPDLSGPRGYALTGWYTDAACTRAYDFSSPVAGDLTLYAGWRPLEEYTVSFDRLDGSGETSVICYSGETPPMPETPVRDGYTFGGWYTDPGCASPWTTGPVSGDLALYAGWTELPQARTVTFDSRDGTAVKPQTVLDGERATQPEDPAREGYTFEGWHANAACTEIWDFERGVTEDLTLYAGWCRNEYTVDFVDTLVNPDSFTTVYERVWKTLTVAHGERIEGPDGPPSTPDGYLFVGWMNDGLEVYDFDRPVTGDLRLVTEWVRPDSGSGGTNDGMDWNLTEDGVLSFSGSGGTGNYEMYYDDYWPKWYGKRTSILSIEVGEGAESAGRNSFNSCTYARSVSLPEGLRYIGDNAFSYCLSLTEVNLPSSVEEIGSAAFEECESLRSVRVPSLVTELWDRTFYNCRSLKSAGLPDGLRSIGMSAFYGCGSLRSVELPDGLESIGERAFEGCGSLTEVRVPGGVRLVSESAFESCGRLERIELAEGVEELGPSAFAGCDRLKSVTIPKSLQKIGRYAFCFYSDREGPLHIFYAGSREDWESIDIHEENELDQAVIHYNCPEAGTLYPITFDSQGGSAVEGQLRLDGELVEEPGAPAREGYTFEGWYAGDVRWDFARNTAGGETVLRARWVPVSHEVRFSGGDVRKAVHGESLELPAAPVLAGSRFNGWYTDPETEHLYLSGAPVMKDLTLYPGWVEERKELPAPDPDPVDPDPVDPDPYLTAEWTGGAVRLSGPPERLSALKQVWAASYDQAGRLTDLAAGQPDGAAVTFPDRVSAQWRLFLLDARGAPLGEGGTME